jgi:hypothetical protein
LVPPSSSLWILSLAFFDLVQSFSLWLLLWIMY